MSTQPKVPAKPAASGARRPNHLKLVADHGRMVDPAFQPGRPVWVSGVAVRPTGGDEAGRRVKGPHGAAPDETRRTPRPAGMRAGGRPAEGRPAGGRKPVRLTRRGRLVLTSGIVLLISVASMVLASAAQAAIHP